MRIAAIEENACCLLTGAYHADNEPCQRGHDGGEGESDREPGRSPNGPLDASPTSGNAAMKPMPTDGVDAHGQLKAAGEPLAWARLTTDRALWPKPRDRVMVTTKRERQADWLIQATVRPRASVMEVSTTREPKWSTAAAGETEGSSDEGGPEVDGGVAGNAVEGEVGHEGFGDERRTCVAGQGEPPWRGRRG